MTPDILDDVRRVVTHTLQLGSRGAHLTAESPLLGALPELDSLAVASLIVALEEHFGFAIAEDEISAATFSTLGDLTAFMAAQGHP
ncbi:acyl carrier protein [Rhodoferax sp. 4810]|uniref:Acyl carrier protein n=2 Tax=Thiospirillum jenense TaxID=1653858 RepID=A0A839H570_9GAMM|nr:acyl carrier protein [Thiospirillum jenense]MBB1076288.1 acyl carrier protein [Rhodoferax jenense]MBB1124881.1 acyl carrier protein [Thiospirillum jenense]